jgi:adenylate kinase family enzyme
MLMKLFILGRPGSGKSAAGRYIAMLAQQKGLPAVRINDYNILLKMFQAEVRQGKFEKFLPTPYFEGGFDVIDFPVFDIALADVKRQADDYISSDNYSLIIIEFARADYGQAMKQFGSAFLQNAYFLLIQTGIKTCIDRINERIAHPVTSDDHYVSDKIMKNYYQKDNLLYMPAELRTTYNIPSSRIEIIYNRASRQAFFRRLDKFIETISALEVYPLPETDPIQTATSTVLDNRLKCEQ